MLRRAVRKGDLSRLKLLLDAAPCLANSVGERGETPLHWASYLGDHWVVGLLIAKGADVDEVGEAGMSPLHLAACRGASGLEVVKTLLENGADVDGRVADSGFTCLHLAVRSGEYAMVETLLANGALVNAEDSWKRTPLDIARLNEHTEIEKLLEKHGDRENKS